ncbi:MAG: sigma-70 family RNA polymerase sigma factor, partial [Oscillospiraceae bacterium]|nr:sigma-70 family RNA polymerase sigma factor [Oscillospiraceae bacterium]
MKQIYEQITAAQNGDKIALDQLVEQNIGLIWNIAKRFYGRGYEPDDIFQLGSIGLVKAIQKFDCSFQTAFSTYAVPMIIGEIRRFMRDDGMIKVSRSLKDLNAKAKATREKLGVELGREPFLHEIAADLEVEVEELARAMDANLAHESLFEEHGETENTLLESTADESVLEDDVTFKIFLQNELSKCSANERSIIMMRYFEGKTQSEIGRLLGIS